LLDIEIPAEYFALYFSCFNCAIIFLCWIMLYIIL
jgi:hypothetical protein